MPYFGKPVGRVKIQTTSKNSQRYYTTKRLIRDLLSNTPNCYVHGRELHEYFFYGGMRDSSMRSRSKLAREIQLTDWSMAGNLSNRSSGVQIPRDICTHFGRYLYSTRCSWIIMPNLPRLPPRCNPYCLRNSFILSPCRVETVLCWFKAFLTGCHYSLSHTLHHLHNIYFRFISFLHLIVCAHCD